MPLPAVRLMNRRLTANRTSVLDRAPETVDTNAHCWKRAWLACAVIALLFFLKFAAFALYITPLWDSPDEPGHYSYIVTLSEGQYPTLGETPIDPAVVKSWLGPSAEHRARQNWIAQHPPLYYALATPVELATRALGVGMEGRVRATRLVNSLLGALTVLGLIACIATATRDLYLGLAGALFVAATPMFTQLSGAVSNDVLVACTAAWGAYWYVRWTGSNRRAHLLACAFIIGLGCITKITMLVVAVPMFFALGWRVARLAGMDRPWRTLGRISVLWITMFGLVAAWIVHNYLVLHTLLPTARMLHGYTHDATHIGFFHFMHKYALWQSILWNFIGLIGWMGTVTGKVITATADGLVVKYYVSVILLTSFAAMLYPVRRLATRNLDWLAPALAVLATVGLYLSLAKMPYTTAACIMLFVAVVVTAAFNLRAVGRPEGSAWLLLSGAAFILFFTFVYYYKIWGFYNQIAHVKGLHGRYFYPVLPWFLLLLLRPLRHKWMPMAALAVSVVALMVADSFFLHFAFEMYGKY